MFVKTIATSIIAFFMLGNVSPFLQNVQDCNCGDPPCWPELSGTMGENNWYVSSVRVGFNGSFTQIVYRIDGGSWTVPTTPFSLTTDGIHLVEWTCDGNISNSYSIEIKIDKNYPDLLWSCKRIGIGKWQFNANVSDPISGVNRVEFYVGKLIGVDTEPPYQMNWTRFVLFPILNFLLTLIFGTTWYGYVIAFDNAGNYNDIPFFPMLRSTWNFIR